MKSHSPRSHTSSMSACTIRWMCGSCSRTRFGVKAFDTSLRRLRCSGSSMSIIIGIGPVSGRMPPAFENVAGSDSISLMWSYLVMPQTPPSSSQYTGSLLAEPAQLAVRVPAPERAADDRVLRWAYVGHGRRCAPGGTENRRNIGCAPWGPASRAERSPTRASRALRARIGVAQPHPQPPHYRYPNEDAFRHVAESYGDDNPLWCDPDYAPRQRVGRADRAAAPRRRRHAHRRGRGEPRSTTDAQALLKGDPLGGAHAFYSGSFREWWAPLRPGMRRPRRNALVGVHDKQSEFADRAVHEWTAEVFAARDPDVALTAQYRLMIRTERTKAEERASTTRSRSARTPTTSSRAIDAALRRRGRAPARRRAALVGGRRGGRRDRPGREGPAARHRHDLLAHRHGHGPLRREGAAARLPAAPAGAAVLPARRPQHPRRAAARALGRRVGAAGRQPATYDYGRMRETWLVHLCTDWMGDDAWLWKLDCEFRQFNYVGDTHWMRGPGRAQATSPTATGRRSTSTCWGENQRGETTTPGHATILLPSREHGPVRLPDPPGGATTCAGLLEALTARFGGTEVGPMIPASVPGLDVALDGAVLRLTLDRPDRRNAIDDTMMAGLIDALAAAGTDEAVRVVLLRGAGDHFCAGADIVARNAPGGDRPRAGSIQRRLPTQAHRLIPLAARDPGAGRVRGAGLGGRARLPARARGRRVRRRRRRHGSGSRSASAASRPTAARRGCCRAGSARSAPASCSCSAGALIGPRRPEWGAIHRAVPRRDARRRDRRARRAARGRPDRRARAHQVAAAPGPRRPRSPTSSRTRRSRSSCRRAPRTSARASPPSATSAHPSSRAGDVDATPRTRRSTSTS